jgi:hypothetical protein
MFADTTNKETESGQLRWRTGEELGFWWGEAPERPGGFDGGLNFWDR